MPIRRQVCVYTFEQGPGRAVTFWAPFPFPPLRNKNIYFLIGPHLKGNLLAERGNDLLIGSDKGLRSHPWRG
jgi:hypothetical protein